LPLAAPPRPPAPSEPDAVEAREPQEQLDALIEEARRRARRRRRGYGALAVMAMSAVAVLVVALGRSEHGPSAIPPPALDSSASPAALDRAALRAGRLTLIAYGGGPAEPDRSGWYAMYMLDRSGRLRPFLRCPDRAAYCGVIEALDWSPNGRWLAFTVGAHALTNPYIGLHLLDTTTGEERRVRDDGVCSYVERSDLAWSPDGSRVAYACSTPARARVIVLAGLDGTIRKLPTDATARNSSPAWSPRGDAIAFASRAPGQPPTIAVTPVGGVGAARVLATDGTAPDWSPDGETIAYRAGCGGIKLVTPRGRDVTPARGPLGCRTIGVSGTPVWSPDGKRLAINNRTGVYLVDRDGSGLHRITRHTGIGHHGGHPAWRPG
jgi:Tol biopolymer transport system component